MDTTKKKPEKQNKAHITRTAHVGWGWAENTIKIGSQIMPPYLDFESMSLQTALARSLPPTQLGARVAWQDCPADT